jgi:protein SCO1/2
MISRVSLCTALVAMTIGLSACSQARRAGKVIATRNGEARGGREAWRKVKTMSMSGKLDAGVRRDPVKLAMAYEKQQQVGALGAKLKPAARHALAVGASPTVEQPVQLPFEMELARPRKSRLEIEFQGQTAVQVYDGKQGWKLRPFLGRREVEPYSADELHLASQQAELDGPLIDYSSKGNSVDFVGSEKVDGKDAYKLAVLTDDGTLRHIWVDKATYLEVKVEGTRRLDGKPRPVYTYYRDYRKVDGLMIPFLLETVVDGVAGSERIVVDKVTINPPIADARFTRPDPLYTPKKSAEARPDAQPKAAPAPAAADAKAPHEAGKLARATVTTADYKLPPVTLLRDDGKSVSLHDELDDGKPVILNFVFTTCSSICPLMSQSFAQLQDKLGLDRNKVHMVSISIDPEQDRPARLVEYAKKFHAGPQWRHYTGTTQASVAVQRAFDAYRGDKMNHTPLTFMRGAPGKRWERIDGFATPDELAGEVRALLAGK